MVEYAQEQIDGRPPCSKLDFCLTADLTGNDWADIIIGGFGDEFPAKNCLWAAEQRGVTTAPLRSMTAIDEANLLCYEKPGVERQDVSFTLRLDVGGAVADITGTGRPNVVAGQGPDNTEVYWLDLEADPRTDWDRYFLTNRFGKHYDLTVATGIENHKAKAVDVTGDGRPDSVGKSYRADHHVDVLYNAA